MHITVSRVTKPWLLDLQEVCKVSIQPIRQYTGASVYAGGYVSDDFLFDYVGENLLDAKIYKYFNILYLFPNLSMNFCITALHIIITEKLVARIMNLLYCKLSIAGWIMPYTL